MPQFHKLLQNAETDQRKIYPWSSSKNIYNLLSILLNITPSTLMLILHIRKSIYSIHVEQ